MKYILAIILIMFSTELYAKGGGGGGHASVGRASASIGRTSFSKSFASSRIHTSPPPSTNFFTHWWPPLKFNYNRKSCFNKPEADDCNGNNKLER